MQNSKHSGKSRRDSLACVMLRCLLVFAAWQGPIPFAHSHCNLASQSHTSHLREHAHRHGDSDAHSQWHLHVSLPVQKGSEPNDLQHEQEVPLLNLESSQSLTAPLVRTAQLSVWIFAPALQPCREIPRASEAIATRTHFFDSFAPTLPLPLRFSILRS